MLSVGSDWKIFAALGPLALIRSFENLGPRVAERNYQFNAQLKMTVASSALGLSLLVVALYVWRNHTAIVMCQLGINVGLVLASQVFSDVPYRIKFRSPQFIKAFKFGYPLMINGFGLAISGQGDRFVVGSLLGLQTLGVYNVVLMVTVVPISMIFRVMGTTNLAAFYNASTSAKLFQQRIRLAGELSPLVATVYALGIAALMNVVTPVLFGARFAIGRTEISLLALAAFVRIIRVEPFTSFLLLQQRTKRLAASSLAVLSGLAFAFLFIKVHPTIDAALCRPADGRGDKPCCYGRADASAARRQLGPLWLRRRVGVRHRCGSLCRALVFAAGSRSFVRSITLAVGACIVIPWGYAFCRRMALTRQS